MPSPTHSHGRAAAADRRGRRGNVPAGVAVVISVFAVVAAMFGTAAASEAPTPTPTCAGLEATIVAVAGVETIGTPGDDVIVGTAGDDVIFGRGGDDVICALGGDDLVFGGPGSDLVFGGPGHDRIRGGAGNDILHGGPGNDRIDGGPGRDRIRGGSGVDRCAGGPGADRNVGCDRLVPAARRPAVHAIGDSVLLGATDTNCAALTRVVPGIAEDAAVSRQFAVGVDLVANARAATSGEMIFVIALGTNGPFADADFDALVAAAGPNSRFVFVNVHAPRDWEEAVNQGLADGVARHPRRAVLVDWYGLAAQDRTLTGSDEIHLTCEGAATLAEAIADGVISWS